MVFAGLLLFVPCVWFVWVDDECLHGKSANLLDVRRRIIPDKCWLGILFVNSESWYIINTIESNVDFRWICIEKYQNVCHPNGPIPTAFVSLIIILQIISAVFIEARHCQLKSKKHHGIDRNRSRANDVVVVLSIDRRSTSAANIRISVIFSPYL